MPVVVTSLIAVGLVMYGTYRVAMLAKTQDPAVASLLDVSNQAMGLVRLMDAVPSDGGIAANQHAQIKATLRDLIISAQAVETTIRKPGGDAILARPISKLNSHAQYWNDLQPGGTSAGGSDVASSARPADDLTRALRAAAGDVSTTARARAEATADAQDHQVFQALLQLGALVGFAMLVGVGIMFRKVVQSDRRVQALPGQLETMVFGNPNAAKAAETAGVLVFEGEAASRLQTFAQKIRAQLRENEKMERMAFADPLTGLPNRRGLLAFLDHLAESDELWEGDNKIGLIHIDLDHFKTINDTLGHDAGDTVLREATKRMSTAIRDSDLLARLGGDEFLVVATAIECEADLTPIADRLIEQFEAPIQYNQRACPVGISMGLVLGGQRGRVRDPKRLLINADMALFKSKSEGRGRYSVFTSAMAEEVRRRNERSIALGDALHEDAFRPWFQPMIDRDSGEIVGLELLARWHDPERGVLMPHEFLEDAEASSLMEEIGLQVLSQSLKAVREWRLAGISTVPTIHMNLGRSQLLSSSFVDRFSWALDEANISTDQFAIEVDEKDCSSRGGEVAFENVRRLHQMGLKIVLDNFGSEQASLSILRGVQATMVKCSHRNIKKLVGNRSDRDLTYVLNAMNDAAMTMGIKISAKGVETDQESNLFLRSGICLQQGDYLASVLDVQETRAFLQGGFQTLAGSEQRVS